MTDEKENKVTLGVQICPATFQPQMLVKLNGETVTSAYFEAEIPHNKLTAMEAYVFGALNGALEAQGKKQLSVNEVTIDTSVNVGVQDA